MREITRVAIAGLGVIAPGAVGRTLFTAMLHQQQSAIRPVQRFDVIGLHAQKAALVEEFQARDFIPPMKMRRMNQLSRFGVAATRMAMEDLEQEVSAPGSAIGVAVGTAFGPVETSVEYMEAYVTKGAALAPPQLFAESVANAPGSHIAIEYGLTGFNLTFTQRESSTLTALLHAGSQIVKGSVRFAIAGGVEQMSEMTFSVLDRIGALAHATAETDEQCRPFDRARNGIVVGEGAAVFILAGEHEPATPTYGYLSGFAIARDRTAPLSDWGEDAETLARTMQAALDDAGIAPSDVDAVWASANSSVRCDRLEYRAIQSLFGDRIPPVVAAKCCFGEYAGAGALQVASAAIAMKEQCLFATTGFREGEPGMCFEPNRTPQQTRLRHILINSLSAGGGIVCAVLSR